MVNYLFRSHDPAELCYAWIRFMIPPKDNPVWFMVQKSLGRCLSTTTRRYWSLCSRNLGCNGYWADYVSGRATYDRFRCTYSKHCKHVTPDGVINARKSTTPATLCQDEIPPARRSSHIRLVHIERQFPDNVVTKICGPATSFFLRNGVFGICIVWCVQLVIALLNFIYYIKLHHGLIQVLCLVWKLDGCHFTPYSMYYVHKNPAAAVACQLVIFKSEFLF